MRLSALRFPVCWKRVVSLFRGNGLAKLGRECAAGTDLLIRPRVVKRSGGGGIGGLWPPSTLGTRRGASLRRSAVEGAPLPPSLARFASFGWSPLPVDAGREEVISSLRGAKATKQSTANALKLDCFAIARNDDGRVAQDHTKRGRANGGRGTSCGSQSSSRAAPPARGACRSKPLRYPPAPPSAARRSRSGCTPFPDWARGRRHP
jgi:hypothetical protein